MAEVRLRRTHRLFQVLFRVLGVAHWPMVSRLLLSSLTWIGHDATFEIWKESVEKARVKVKMWRQDRTLAMGMPGRNSLNDMRL